MLPSETMYPYTAKEARERGELELWRANFRTNCACAGAIELAIRKGFDGMHLWTDCAKSVIDQYGYKRVGFVLANTLQEQSYDGRYAPQLGYALLASGEAERSRLWKKKRTSAHPSRCCCTSGFGRSRSSGARPCPTTSRTYSENILKEEHEL